jgi:hypothetical protein
MALRVHGQVIEIAVAAGETHHAISVSLQQMSPFERGFSARSIRRFCAEQSIHYRCGLTDDQLDRIIESQINAVGHSYGRRTMQGLLAAQDIHVAEDRVGRSMSRVAPGPQLGRTQRACRRLNPPPYMARFFGDKIHYDQNEKLAMYRVTHVMAVDGFSRKIVGMITIPTKNPISIYNALTRPLLLSYGLWQQVRLDHGSEFVLVITAQQHLSNHRQWQDRHPVLQSTSRQNHRVERMWPEVNQRVNYPVKRVLIEMEARDEIDMTNTTIKYCVSWTTINVIKKAIQNFVQAWNSHRIPGIRGGIPNRMANLAPQTSVLLASVVPTPAEIIAIHRRRGGSALTEEHVFGRDPLEGNTGLQQLRERDFRARFPSMEAVFRNMLRSSGALFREATHLFIHLTLSSSQLV